MSLSFFIFLMSVKPAMDIVLGQQWMGVTNFQINQASLEYTLQVNSPNLTGKNSKLETPHARDQMLSPPRKVPISTTTLDQHNCVWI